MSGFILAPEARRDINEMMAYRELHAGLDSAIALEEDLLAAFDRLVVIPGLGHRRTDLTNRPVFFYPLHQYLIVYSRQIEGGYDIAMEGVILFLTWPSCIPPGTSASCLPLASASSLTARQ